MGEPQYLPLIMMVSHYIHKLVRALLPHWSNGLGGKQKSCNDIAFFLISAAEEATGNRNYGLSTMWVNPHQARVPSMEK